MKPLVSGIFLFLATTMAGAADLHQLSQQAIDACRSDIKNLCSDVTPSNGRLAACLESKSDQVSPGCTKAVKTLTTEVDARYEKIVGKFNKACSSDVAQYCGRVPAGEGRILSCLSGREDDLSSKCKDFLDQASTDIDKMLQ